MLVGVVERTERLRREGTDGVVLPPFLVLPIVETPRELRRAPGVVAVIVASFAVVGLGGAWPAVTRALECTTAGLGRWQLWRVMTYVLPHERGWPHVAVNMFVLALFGWQLERIIGTFRFLAVYFGCGAVGMALLAAANPIDSQHGLRGGASLAVFGVVAALATQHAVKVGVRGPAMVWAIPTCIVLLTVAGVLAMGGRGGVIAPGLDGFRFGFLNHALGMIAGVLLGIAIPVGSARPARLMTTAIAALTLSGGLLVGVARWA